MEVEGSIKTLYEDDAAVFPITSTNAVFDEDGTQLSDTIADIYSKIGHGPQPEPSDVDTVIVNVMIENGDDFDADFTIQKTV